MTLKHYIMTATGSQNLRRGGPGVTSSGSKRPSVIR